MVPLAFRHRQRQPRSHVRLVNDNPSADLLLSVHPRNGWLTIPPGCSAGITAEPGNSVWWYDIAVVARGAHLRVPPQVNLTILISDSSGHLLESFLTESDLSTPVIRYFREGPIHDWAANLPSDSWRAMLFVDADVSLECQDVADTPNSDWILLSSNPQIGTSPTLRFTTGRVELSSQSPLNIQCPDWG